MDIDFALNGKSQPQAPRQMPTIDGRACDWLPHGVAWGQSGRDLEGVSGGHEGISAPLCCALGEESGTARGWGQGVSILPPARRERVARFATGNGDHAVSLACAITGESSAALSKPSVAFSAASANSGGHGLCFSCDNLPLEMPILAASWLAFIASGRSKYAARFMQCV